MPLKTWDTKADFDAAYSIGAEPDNHRNTRPEVHLNYHRGVLYRRHERLAERFVEVLGIRTDDTILIAGAAFGWTVEALKALGYTRSGATETSLYCQTNKDANEDADIRAAIVAVGLDPDKGEGYAIWQRLRGDGGTRARVELVLEAGLTVNSRTGIKASLGGDPSIVISESVVESLTDPEAIAFSLAMREFNPRKLAHFVFTRAPAGVNQRSGYNWKSAEEWKALLTPDMIVEASTYRVL